MLPSWPYASARFPQEHIYEPTLSAQVTSSDTPQGASHRTSVEVEPHNTFIVHTIAGSHFAPISHATQIAEILTETLNRDP
jgi:hypothetical protein